VTRVCIGLGSNAIYFSNIAGVIFLALETLMGRKSWNDIKSKDTETKGRTKRIARALISSQFRNMVFAVCIFTLQICIMVSQRLNTVKYAVINS
jgi:hypothetical protein